jgi:hypothetical protein
LQPTNLSTRSIARSLTLDRYDKYLLIKAPDSFEGDFIALCRGCLDTPDLVQPEFLHWFNWNQHLRLGEISLRELLRKVPDQKVHNDSARREGSHSPTLRRNPIAQYADELDPQPEQHAQEEMKPRTPSPSSGALKKPSDAFESEGFLARFQRVTLDMQRRLMITSRGHIGMAPARAMKGDVVAIVLGCHIPVLLRTKDKPSYEVIGECYVDGYMEGKALLEGRKPETMMLV